jgi:hypothetical protein
MTTIFPNDFNIAFLDIIYISISLQSHNHRSVQGGTVTFRLTLNYIFLKLDHNL